MEWITENWYWIIVALSVVGYTAIKLRAFFKLSKEEREIKIKNWLIWAVTEAEAIYGSGTGEIKLPFVYDLFVGKFTWLAKLIPYSSFETFVDDALTSAREIWKEKPTIIE